MKSILIGVALVAAALAPAGSACGQANLAVSAVKGEWQAMSGFVAKSAEQMPESNYSFKPTPAVRSFGELIGHLSDGQTIICSAALGESTKTTEGTNEKGLHTKAELIAAFRASIEICNRAYAQTDAESSGMTKLFGADRTRLAALMRNAVHDGEHYGNIVTYLRLKGMVPPSSQPTQ